MKTLNKYAAEILKKYTIHACTDVTGFGLGGHGTEMAEGSQKTLVIDTRSLPILPDVEEYASMGLIPGGAYRNREFAGKAGYESSAELWREDLVSLTHRHPEAFWQQSRQRKPRSFLPN